LRPSQFNQNYTVACDNSVLDLSEPQKLTIDVLQRHPLGLQGCVVKVLIFFAFRPRADRPDQLQQRSRGLGAHVRGRLIRVAQFLQGAYGFQSQRYIVCCR
jgi:hypothetical protein